MDQPGKVANPARGQLNRENELIGLARLVRQSPSVSLLISILRLNLLTYGIPPEFHGGVHL